MLETGTTQSELSRTSGVRQPSISQVGYRLEIVRRPVKPRLERSVDRSWRLHRQLSKHVTSQRLVDWRPTVLRNLDRLRLGVHGQPHLRNLDRWQRLMDERDLSGLHRVMTGLGTDSIEMREVSPMGGLLSQDERTEALRKAG